MGWWKRGWGKGCLILIIAVGLVMGAIPGLGLDTAPGTEGQPAPMEAALHALMDDYDLYSGSYTFMDIDFADVPRMESQEDLFAFLLLCQEKRVAQAPLRLPTWIKLREATGSQVFCLWESISYAFALGGEECLLTFTLHPGVKIAEAYLRRDPSALTPEEMGVYRQMEIYFRMYYPWQADIITQERAIHDYICQRTSYWTDDGQYPGSYVYFRSALGVFLDGKANCAGLSDAFYMMATIAGFPVIKMVGDMHGEPHAWNLIALHGEWYMVDVTNNGLLSDQIPYQFFNAGKDILDAYYTYEENALIVPLVEETGAYYAYGEESFEFLRRIHDETELVQAIVELAFLKDGNRYGFLLEDFAFEGEAFVPALFRAMGQRMPLTKINYQYDQMGEKLYISLAFSPLF